MLELSDGCVTPTYCSVLSAIILLPLSPSPDSNTSLVRACWNELFTLGLAQCAQIMNLSTILAAIISHLQSSIQDGMATSLSTNLHMCPDTNMQIQTPRSTTFHSF